MGVFTSAEKRKSAARPCGPLALGGAKYLGVD
jgi:hypothetical protein